MAQIELHDGVEKVLLRNYEYGWEVCWIKRRTDKDTKAMEEYWCAGKWYPRLYQALEALADMRMRNSDAKTLEELKNTAKNIYKELKGVANAFK